MIKGPRKVALMIEGYRGHERGLLRGIARFARTQGNWHFYLDKEDPFFRDSQVEKRSFQDKLLTWGVNGIITRSPEKVQDFIAAGLPVVIVKQIAENPQNNVLVLDNTAIGTMAARHLIERGFMHFGYCGLDEMFWSHTRGRSFRAEIKKIQADVSIYHQPKPLASLSWEEEQDVMVAWLKSLPKPVGVMACNDDRAEHVIEACKIVQIKVPEEISVIGVDNDELICEFSDPPLSSVGINSERGGYEAAWLLDSLMRQYRYENNQIIIRPTEVVTRQSTDTLPVEDQDVARALNFIRQHARMDIQVEHVAEEVGLSLRVLQKRFKKVLNRSLRDEIKSVCSNQIKKMLLETNLTISQITDILGYSSSHALARFFRKETKMSPGEFRKKYVLVKRP